MTRAQSAPRRWIAAVIAAALTATGAIAIETSTPTPAAAAYPETFNPFAINGGFTVYAREDITLGNDETEGSIAAGGVATKPGDGQYTIIHVAAGTADYTLPTVDGDPTRLLVGSYSPDSGGILAITNAGTSDPALRGDLKMVQRGGPWQTMARSDWIRLNLAGAGSPDQPPIIDATAQVYPGSAAPPPSPADGNGSISTFDASGDAVATYVEANAEADWEQAQSCLDDLVDPGTGTGYPVGVAEDAGDRVVLEPLSPDQPNVVDYAEIAGATLIQFSGEVTPGTENPLIIRVPAGTTDVVGARLDPQGAYSPYTFWDLSQLTGEVSVTAQGRMDGSIYAPNADVTVTAAPLDGQVVGQNVVLLGGEVHSFLFAGTIACTADSGTFRVQKALDGISPDDLPDGTTFTVNYTATDPEGEITTGSLEVPASGDWVDAGTQFAIGTEIEFAEVEPASVPGFEWGPVVIEPESITVGAGTADIVVTNTATALLGTFSVSKQVVTSDGSEPPFPEGFVSVEWTATPPGGAPPSSGAFDVPLDGTPVEPGVDFPVGTVIELSEDASSLVPPDGWEWVGSGWDPSSEITIGDDSTVALTLTNTIAPASDARRITIVKSVSGEAADPAYGYTVTYNQAGGERSEPVDLPVGTPVELSDVDPESGTLDLAEQVPTINGAPTDAADWADPVFLVTVGDETTEYPSGGFDQIVQIPLPVEGDVAVEVTNRLNEGTFELSKELAGIGTEVLPDGARFRVMWTATTPAGVVSEGTLRVPADGTPVGPIASIDGTPLTFPYGTVVDLTEETPPPLPWLSWGDPTFTPEQLVIGEDGADTVTGTVTNSATLRTGEFQVVKELDGIDPGELLVDSFTIEYLARVPGGDLVSGSFDLPADGTPAGPIDAEGAPLQFPIGTIVLLTEVPPTEADLPESYDWASTTWTPANFVVIGSPSTPEITVTNSVEQLTRFSVVKEIEGEGAPLVPADTVFLVDWWEDDEPQTPLEAGIGVPAYSPYIPVGTIAVTNENLPEIPGVVWGPVSWSVNGEPAAVGPDGRVTVQLDTQESVEPIAFALTNTANTAPTSAFSVSKRVEGEAAGAVPDDATFMFEHSIDGAAVQSLELSAGETVMVEDLPGSSTVRVREIPPSEVSGVNWEEATWTVNGSAVAPDSDGWVTVQLAPGDELEFVAVNTAVPDLPATGGGGLSPLVPLGAGMLVLVGLAFLAAARRIRSV